LVPLMEDFFADELRYYTNDEFVNRIRRNGKSEGVSWEDLNGRFNSDAFEPVDGRLVRLSDHLAALLEADSSIKHGITSEHLVHGRESLLAHYTPGETINGIDAGKLFQDLVAP
ncbi:MAG: hydrolase, partial [Treponema socranskii subsp. buccale]